MSPPEPGVVLPSDRSFGRFFSVIFAAAAAYLWLISAMLPALVCAGAAAVTLSLAQFAPRALGPLNRAWARLGLLLGRVVNPMVLGALYFLLITPVAVIGRAFGRDELRLKVRGKAVQSYWVQRAPPGPAGDSFRQPF